MAKNYGIDVSHHQGTINWKQTASELRRVNGGTSPGFAGSGPGGTGTRSVCVWLAECF